MQCNGCKGRFRAHWLRDGKCNGCRNPSLIVEAMPRYQVRKVINPRKGWIILDTVKKAAVSCICKTKKEAVQLLDRGQYDIG
jgi:hypothetical protein